MVGPRRRVGSASLASASPPSPHLGGNSDHGGPALAAQAWPTLRLASASPPSPHLGGAADHGGPAARRWVHNLRCKPTISHLASLAHHGGLALVGWAQRALRAQAHQLRTRRQFQPWWARARCASLAHPTAARRVGSASLASASPPSPHLGGNSNHGGPALAARSLAHPSLAHPTATARNPAAGCRCRTRAA